MEKYHKTDIAPVEQENERDENYQADNPQIDFTRTRNNYNIIKSKVFADSLPSAIGIKFKCRCGVVSSICTTAEIILSSPYLSAKKQVQSTKNCRCSCGESFPKNSLSEPTTKEHISTASLRTFVGKSSAAILSYGQRVEFATRAGRQPGETSLHGGV